MNNKKTNRYFNLTLSNPKRKLQNKKDKTLNERQEATK